MHDPERRDLDALQASDHQVDTAASGGNAPGVVGCNSMVHGNGPERWPATGIGAPVNGKIRLLMLAANPDTTRRLAVDEEARQIGEKLRLAQDRDAFTVTTCLAVRPADLLQYFNQHRPHIVHFSGHGSSAGEIVLSNGFGEHRVSTEALTETFRVMKDNIRIVMLNACYSSTQAQAISRHIDFIIGMRSPIEDRAAIVFAAAFYSALGFQRSVQEAFDQAITAIMLHGLPGHLTPELIIRPGADPHAVFCGRPTAPDGAGGHPAKDRSANDASISPISPWPPVQMSATASDESSIYQVGAGAQYVTVNNFAVGQPLDLTGLRTWIDRLSQACADSAMDASINQAARRSLRHRTELISDIRRDLADSGRQSKGKDCLRRLLVTGIVQFHASVGLTSWKPSEQTVLDLLVFGLWPVIQAHRLPKGWHGYLAELTSPLIAQVVIDAREIGAGRVDPPLLTRGLAAFPLNDAASNLLQDLGDPSRGYGVVTAVAMAARLPVPAEPGTRSLVTWLVAGAVGAEVATKLIVDLLDGPAGGGTGSSGDSVTSDIGTSGGSSGRGGGALKHMPGVIDATPDHTDAAHDIIDHLFH